MPGVKGKSGIYKRKPFTEEHRRKMRDAQIGNKNALGSIRTKKFKENVKKMMIGNKYAKSGKDSHFWKDGRCSKLNYKIEYDKEWSKKHPDYKREYMKKHYKKYYKKMRQDPKRLLNSIISNQIRDALKGKKAGRHWESLVDYTLQDLMAHLESLFEPWMNWENYGKWHIDHKRPKSWFKYKDAEDPEFKKCWSLNNLQPLEAKKNFKKNNLYED